MRLLFYLLFALVLAAPPLRAQSECPAGRITHVFVDNHSIYDPASLPDDLRVRWAYRLANRLHVRTREGFIRDELLFEEGDCFDEEVLRETGRVLREYRFISRADLFEVQQPDGSRHVVVDTRDEWTTRVALMVRFDERFEFDGLSIVEENFLGRGVTVGAFTIDSRERREVGALAEVPRVFGTRWGVGAGATRTRAGSSFRQIAVLPFEGEVGTRAMRQQVIHREDFFAYVLPEDAGTAGLEDASHLIVPLQTARMELTGAVRVGSPGSWMIVGGGISHEEVVPGALTEVELVRGGDFANREAADAEAAAPLSPHLRSRRATRLNGLFGIRSIRYREMRGLDPVDGIQDVPIGRQILFALGPHIGPTDADRARDTFVRSDLFYGRASSDRTLQLHLTSEGRFEPEEVSGAGHARDVLVEGNAHLYLQPESRPSHTLLFRVAANAAWNVTGPYQLTLGGVDGVRGYSDTQLPTGRRVVGTFEDRIRVPSPFPDLMDLGVTAFADRGGGGAGDAPFAVDTGFRASLGVGLRLGFPAGSGSVVRADFSQPLRSGSFSAGPIFRISATEYVGILDAFRSLQFSRSRRSGIRADFTGMGREAGVP